MSDTRHALAAAWANLPDQIKAHPGVKALHRAALATQPAQPDEAQMKAPQDGMQFWLWKNGDHFLAFTHLYPCFTPGGDPMVLGEPVGRALFRRSHDRSCRGNATQNELPKARSLTDELMDCVDRLGSEWREVDPRVWDHLRVYMPAQPVAGAVATEPSEEIQELRAQVEAWRKQCGTLTNQVICCGVAARHPDATLTTRGAYAGKWNSPQAELVRKLRAERDALLAASPQPAPSAQAVAHQSHQTVREWMPVSEALRLSDLWTAGDLDNCGQWRAAIKVLADEVRALAASPQPEPSAHGEQVATVTEEMVTAYLTANDAYWKRIDGEPTKLGKWRNGTPSEATRVSLMAALAAAPSTPPPAVVEAVPLTDEQADALRRLWPAIEKAMGCLVFTAEQAGAVQADMNTIRHGIAPKAAQEKT